MDWRIFLIALAGYLMLSVCGGAKTPPQPSTAAVEASAGAPEPAAAEAAHPEDSAAEPTAPEENRYHAQGWDRYNDYVYMQDDQPKYWIEFDGELCLHCMFRSGSPEYYEAVYTLYPDWDASAAQELIIRTVTDAAGNDISYRFASLAFAFSSEDMVLMRVERDESTLAGGAEDNLLTGDYVFLPR